MSGAVRISDHALVRWLERTGALEIEALREQLARSLDRAGEAADALGGGDYLIVADGLTYVVKNAVLVTVLEDKGVYDYARRLTHGR
jgi:hypothetical protein